ncbi:hypothetical protein [Sphingomonas rubra]|uniref:4-amino-4-deoxy-L-arabinose transferase n=1 Tax=Sphingomonas rubra TaxID=634430 RepID=A0A1I5PLN4_9SPHN|nr:hypothetical protein [Sphingomonas rubra]SFP34969.1 hypothetical protein SAMN04488241_10195 [Sphingomonas rubra]
MTTGADATTRSWTLPALLLLAVALRGWDIGNPVLDLDEQWYLLVDDRVLRGAIPFVDLWDRKPVGLFLLFAGFRLIPGDTIVVYQIAATIAAGLTAATIARIADATGAAPRGSLVAGALYLLAASVIGGQGGQAPVFYNLPVALAALATVGMPRLIAAGATGRIVARGGGACLLAGIAMQIKYTVAFEAAFVGLAHVWALRRAGGRPVRVALVATGWMLAGLLPTLAVVAAYARLGPDALHAFWFANFVSITLRHAYPPALVVANLGSIVGQIAPLLVPAIIAIARPGRSTEAALARWWLAAALIGFLSIGTFHDHYALPLLPPLAVVAATVLGRSRWLSWTAIVAALAIFAGERLARRDDAAGARQVIALVRSVGSRGCPYVFMGDPITCYLADACVPTPYAFLNTLAQRIEQGATGIDEAGEVARIMRNRPPVVVTSDRQRMIWNVDSRRVVDRALVHDYRLRLVVPRGRWHTLVYVRRDLAER